MKKHDVEADKFRRLIYRELRRIDPRWQPNDPSFRAMRLLLYTFAVGFDVDRLVTFSREPKAFVEATMRRARKSGIIRGDALRMRWLDDEYATINTIADALVASGQVARVPPQDVQRKGREVRQQRKAKGLCSNCGQGKEDPSLSTCAKCRVATTRSHEKRDTRGKEGIEIRTNSKDQHYVHNKYADARHSTDV